MFQNVNKIFNDVVDCRLDNGWYQLKLDYFERNPEILRTVCDRLRVSKTAEDRIRERYRNLNKIGRSIGQCPKRGVAVRHGTSAFIFSWMQYLTQTFHEHYGDVLEPGYDVNASAEAIDRFVCAKHEEFQLRKMGFFAPYQRGALRKSVDNFMSEGFKNNREHIDISVTDVILDAFSRVRDEDLGGIANGSLTACDAQTAVYESNVQGLATGYVQLRRDEILDVRRAREMSIVYNHRFEAGRVTADELVRAYEQSVIDFDLGYNVVTNLKRVQVGGLDIDLDVALDQGIQAEHVKKAKYRTINTNDPMIQIAEASIAIPFREAVKEWTNGIFYNTLFEPDGRFSRIKESLLEGEKNDVTQFPFDFELHDARQHAEWMFNLMQHVVKPKFAEEYWDLVDLTTICLVFKIILRPVNNSGDYEPTGLVGALGSGDPWTNIYGTLGTRAVARLLATVRPDIFFCSPKIGFNNGDDTCIGVWKSAIKELGIDTVIRIANDIVNSVHYFFNDAKLIMIPVPENNYVSHWEQFCYWFNGNSQDVRRHGSTLRYFGKVYTCEDAGRETPLEGILDQLSTLNQTIGYVGDQQFITTTMNVEVLIKFLQNDAVLMDYVNKYGKEFFKAITRDSVAEEVARLKKQRDEASAAKGNGKVHPKAKLVSKNDSELEDIARKNLSRRLRIDGRDADHLSKVIHDDDFSFFGISKLVGLGVAELTRIAAVGKGRTILLTHNGNEDMTWKTLNAS